MPALSVLVATLNPGSALPDLVRSLDAQTLAVADFEVVVVDASNDGSTARLQQLAGRRPNVTVLTAGADRAVADRIGMALERATGEYVLVVAQDQYLAPRALELLLDRARRADADVVLGRVVRGGSSGSAVLPEDADRVDLSGADGATVDVRGCVAAVRRSLFADRADAGAAVLDLPALVGAAGGVGAVARYACARRAGDSVDLVANVSLDRPTYRWDGGMLQLTATVSLPGPAGTDARAWLVVAQGLAELALPATIGSGEREPAALRVTAALDPGTAAAGHPLEDGPWDLRLRLAWAGREATLPVAPGPARSAVIDGRPYVVHPGAGVAQLDVGALRTSVIGPVTQSQASIAETADGTLVTFEHPDLHVHGDAVLEAKLLLDGFGLPAHLVCRDGAARLQAYASSLAGTKKVSVVAGGGRPVATGLQLRVDGVGGMVLERAPAPRPAPRPGPSKPAVVPVAQRLRRAVPQGLDPLLRRIVQVPAARRIYRRLINR